MHILIAPNAFKGSLTAYEAADAIGQGLLQSRLDCTVECFPIGDGGDGTAELLVRAGKGEDRVVQVQDPLGRKIDAHLGLIDRGRTAVIESADASGLKLLHPNELNPLRATSFGTGELIRRALDLSVRTIVLGVGGTATVDGGAGLLQALGARFLGAGGAELAALPESLPQLDSIDLAGLDPRLATCELIVMSDVDNPLTGRRGAAAVFGPQKGATPAAVEILEAGLTRLGQVLEQHSGRDITHMPRGGAAGGIVATLHGLLEATPVNGIDYFLDKTGFDAALQKADLVITAEGGIDDQTLQGKAPFGVAVRAKAKGLPVVALAGSVSADTSDELQKYFDVMLPIGRRPAELREAMLNTARDLQRTAHQLGNALSIGTAQHVQRLPSGKAHPSPIY